MPPNPAKLHERCIAAIRPVWPVATTVAGLWRCVGPALGHHRAMGQIADTVGRKLLNHEFEASCGDARPDGSCPVFIARHGRDVVTAEVIVDGPLLRASYTTTDRTLDDDDILRVFVLAYLERFTCHFYQATVKTIELRNSTTGAMRSTAYPDRAWLEPEWNS